MTAAAGRKPLEGIRVLEIGSVVLAPYAAQLLADMGASVIKIEPLNGDNTRRSGTVNHLDGGALFLNCNRGKQSIAVDLKRPESGAIIEALVRRSDVLIHNLRPDAAQRLGLDYATVQAVHPPIVYCGAYGFGANGPMAELAAYDDIIQAACGIAALNGAAQGEPGYAATLVADKTTALFVALGVTSALLRRATTGVGEQLEVAMFETMVHVTSVEHLDGLTFADAPGPAGYKRILNNWRRPHRTLDGSMAVLPYSRQNWIDFFAAAGRAEIMHEARFSDDNERPRHLPEMYRILSEVLPARTNAQWAAVCVEYDIPHSPVNSMADLVADPHLAQVGFWHHQQHPVEGCLRVPSFPVRYGGPGGDAQPAGRAPLLGEHTSSILASIGMARPDIDRLTHAGVVGIHRTKVQERAP